MKKSKMVLQLALLGILGVAVLGSTLRIAQMGDDYRFFDPLVEVKHLLDTRAYRPAEPQALQNAAIEGMVEAVGDDYTVYVPPTESEDFEKRLIGEYVGIGAAVNIEEGYLTIVTPLDGSPAIRAGIQAGDKIVEIEGESTLGKTIDDNIELLMGEPGVPVNVTVERDGERFPVEIVRDHINTVQVKGIERRGENDWRFMLDEERKIAYIWLTQFTPGCAAEVREALESVGASKGELNGLIFDLRWNPGGVLREAVDLVDMFIDEGVVVTTRSRDGDEDVDRATTEGTLPDFPVVILLNRFSASASEVFSGALVDHDRAVVLGERSVGKGSVQSVIPIPSAPGAILKITDRNYYLPSGRSIQRTDDSAVWGVDPTPGFYVPLTQEEAREVARARQAEDIIRDDADNLHAGSRFADPGWIETELRDVQLAAAMRAIAAKIETGEWLHPGSDQPVTELAAQAELKRLAEGREQLILELERLQRRIGAIEGGTDLAAADLETDLWPDETNVAGGTVEVRDAEGNIIAQLEIVNESLERWLVGAGLEPKP
ncbi:MAG: S41 family peptidase [Planctomycetota bacterium]|nr:S41 family peptidase [Planctomycetota bacterium]